MQTATSDTLRRGRLFIVALLALFTAGAAVSMRAATAVHMRGEYLDPIDAANAGVMLGTVLGAAFAGFAITLLLVSAVLARIGFRNALIAAAALMIAGFAIVAGAGSLGISPYTALYAGMVVQGLGWGMVETVINPLTSAVYAEDRVSRLSILHAWYPAGVVGGALMGLAVDGAALPWRLELMVLAVLAVAFAVMAWSEKFPPVSASTDAPVTPGEMIKATIQSPTIFLWVFLMMFTAAAEFAPGQWVDVALTQIVGMRGIWLLVYVSALMFVMRHFAGPLVRVLGNVGLLIMSAIFTTIGLFALSMVDGPIGAILASTAWGFGVCFFWPTMLATVAERYPRSGTMVFGLMGAAGAACTWVVLPLLGMVSDSAKLEAAGGDPAVVAAAQGAQLQQILAAAAEASFRSIAIIPLVLIVIFTAIAIADRMRKRPDVDALQREVSCDLLYRHWAQGSRLDALPADLLPGSRAEAYQVQACIERHTSQPLYGWKIAATSVAGQTHIGVDGPLAGRILAERVIEEGGDCPLGNNLMKVAEMEFAFRMASDLPPRDSEYTQDEVMAAVASLHPAIEIPDSRYNRFESVGLASLIADNACAHRFTLGAAASNWREVDLAAHKVRGLRNGAVAEEGQGSNVLGSPVIALTWLVNELSRHGLTLKAGQVVTTGTCVKPLAIAAGDRVEGDFGQLGRVALAIT